MECHECGRAVEVGQRFCGGCGASLRGVTDKTEIVAAAEPTSEWIADDPVWAATGAVPTNGAPARSRSADPVRTTDLPATEPVGVPAWPLDATPDVAGDEVWAPTSEAYTGGAALPAGATAELPTVRTPPTGASMTHPRNRFRLNAVTVFGVMCVVAALAGSFTVAVGVESDTRLVAIDDGPPIPTGRWYLDDLADNMSIAVLVATVLLVVGAVAAGFRWRWGSGLAGGAGLAMAGLAAVAVGLAEFPLDAARDYAAVPSEQPFMLTLTHDVGYFLLVAAAALGVIVFFASINDAFGDQRANLNPWIAALGALATVVTVIGPLLPEGTAVFSDNWYLIEGPGQPSALLVAGRLVQLALLAITGIFGYLSVRRWGLGLAIGGAMPIVWLAVSSLFELTDNPVGPGYRNPGATDSALHGVTIIGISAIVAMAILALVAAYDQSTRAP